MGGELGDGGPTLGASSRFKVVSPPPVPVISPSGRTLTQRQLQGAGNLTSGVMIPPRVMAMLLFLSEVEHYPT